MSKLRAEYDALAERYDRRWARYVERTNRWALEALDVDCPGAAGVMVDVGCGTGALLTRLAQRGASPMPRLIGLDFSPAMLRVARRRVGPGIALAAAAADALPLADASVDVLASVNVLHFAPDPAATLRQWHRVLAPGGRLIVVAWCADHWPTRLIDMMLRFAGRQPGRALGQHAWHRLVADAGFTDVQVSMKRMSWSWGLVRAVARRPAPD